MGRAAGRPTKLIDSRRQVILDTLKAGNTRTASAEYAGTTRETLWRWMESDVTFRNDVLVAEATAEVRNLAIVLRAAQQGDPRAAQWWLEKRRRREYGVQAMEITGLDGGPIKTEEVTLNDHERDALRKAIDAELSKEPV